MTAQTSLDSWKHVAQERLQIAYQSRHVNPRQSLESLITVLMELIERVERIEHGTWRWRSRFDGKITYADSLGEVYEELTAVS
jgi:hypothetical protein